MNQHGLTNIGWRFEFDNAKRRFGCCSYRTKTISLSKELVKLNDEPRVQNTILHEIAHALVGKNHGHDNVWKQKALEIGCDGNRCYTEENTNIVKGKYVATCPKCNHVHNKHRKPKKQSSCGKCSNVFDRERLLIFNLQQ
jgi:predicted SprT family Zn-dependent metalloprotease